MGWSKRFVLAVALLIVAAVKLAFFPASPAPQYLTAQAEITNLEETVLASGTLEAFKQVSVGAQVSGQVKSLKVALGDQVKQGQVIAEIDSLPQQNELRNAEASLESVRAQRRAKQATLLQAELEFKRQREMLAEDATSRQDYESAQATLNATRADIAALDAQIVQASIAVDTARIDLGYTRITSPMDGVVVAIVTKEGQTVNAAQEAPTIVKVAQLDTMTVEAEISEADVVRVEPGQRVYFTILGEPDHRYEATLRSIEPAPESIAYDESSSTSSSSSSSDEAIYYNGLFDVPNPGHKLRISMTAQVTIVLNETKDALTIPSGALGAKDAQGRYTVRVLNQDGMPEKRTVRVGMNDTVNAQILEGLERGGRVIVGEAAADSAESEEDNARPRPPMRL
ncbi:macrolide transporter subunit MacA [Desulfocurvibacter africanus]|uniref:macrolide transporter subunit MacA n=1 Tax=Desulfocurvibacter africanus TaxID=873 RepID=UPI0002E0324A|nr:macrolide transporter subunit MacA [Desulfocurvibacter africanus]